MKIKCDRCGKETDVTTVSMFNTQTICMGCKDAERKHPRYEEAREAERRAYMSGDMNFPGIGWPCQANTLTT